MGICILCFVADPWFGTNRRSVRIQLLRRKRHSILRERLWRHYKWNICRYRGGWDGTPPTPGANSIYTYSSHSFDCGRNLTTGSACASVTYYTVEVNNVACGICPDCGNSNCGTGYVGPNCCDQTNGNLECAPNGRCFTCDNTCISPGTQGTQCCATSDCGSGLICTNGACATPSGIPICGPAGSNCSAVQCQPPDCTDGLGWNPEFCECYRFSTPIIIDTDGSGFHLTSAADGVLFDFSGTGKPIQIAWTAPGSTNGWLALDRNGNGNIDSGKELFGNITEQPSSSDPNGFLALAVFDLPENGGNGDGAIDNQDAIREKYWVWIDANHDGIAQAEELHHLDDVGIHSIGQSAARKPMMHVSGSFQYEIGQKQTFVIYLSTRSNLSHLRTVRSAC